MEDVIWVVWFVWGISMDTVFFVQTSVSWAVTPPYFQDPQGVFRYTYVHLHHNWRSEEETPFGEQKQLRLVTAGGHG